eukprot:RCo055022
MQYSRTTPYSPPHGAPSPDLPSLPMLSAPSRPPRPTPDSPSTRLRLEDPALPKGTYVLGPASSYSRSPEVVPSPKGLVSPSEALSVMGTDVVQAYSAESARRRMLEDEARQAWQVIAELRNEVEALRWEKKVLQDSAEQLAAQAASGERSLRITAEAELQDLHEKHRWLQMRNQELTSQLEGRSPMARDAADAVAALQAQLQSEQVYRAMLEKELSHANSRVVESETALSSAQAELEAWRQQPRPPCPDPSGVTVDVINLYETGMPCTGPPVPSARELAAMQCNHGDVQCQLELLSGALAHANAQLDELGGKLAATEVAREASEADRAQLARNVAVLRASLE